MTERKSKGRPFQPGQSGNPGGRPSQKAIREILHSYTEKAARRLGKLIDHRSPKIALLAIKEVYDRCYGKPMQGIEMAVEDHRMDHDRQPLTPDEVAVAIRDLLLKAEIEKGIAPTPDKPNSERVERLVQAGPLSPALYAVLQQAGGTRH